MREALSRLAAALCCPGPAASVDEPALRAEAGRTVVIIPAGGFGYRMRAVGDAGPQTQKSLLPLPNGETLIGRLVRQYAQAGFRRVLALVNHEGAAVAEHLGSGERWGVEIQVSFDPEASGSGRTGAMIHAMDQGLLTVDEPAVIHNGDCQVMRYAGHFPLDLLAAHLHALRRGSVATLAAVDGSPYPYTGMAIAEGRVTEVEMYPFIPVPTHTGITAVSPEALADIRANATRSKQNFERDMFPRWAREGRLAAMVISHEQWVAVDDRKTYRLFSEAVRDESQSGPDPRGLRAP